MDSCLQRVSDILSRLRQLLAHMTNDKDTQAVLQDLQSTESTLAALITDRQVQELDQFKKWLKKR